MTDLAQADVETVTRSWSITDDDGTAVVPSTIKFVARPTAGGADIEWTTADGVTDDADGTGSWTITAGDLDVGRYGWWCLATLSSGDVRIPTDLSGQLTVSDH